MGSRWTMVNARKHKTPSENDTTVNDETIFETYGNSIRDVVPVASVTERAQVVAALTAKGEAPSLSAPLYVCRADAPGLHRTEMSTDGVTWVPVSGEPRFANIDDARAFATANGGLLSVGDHLVVAGARWRWNGQKLIREQGLETFSMVSDGVQDAQIISSNSTTTRVDDDSTDVLVAAKTGMAFTLPAGLYRIDFLMRAGVAVTGRTFADVTVNNGPTVARAVSQVGDDAVSVTALILLRAQGVVTLRAFKTTGGVSNLSGRIQILRVE